MALVCASCQTDNRDGAKFCKGCGGRLMPADAASSREDVWPITQPLPLSSGPVPRAVEDETTVIVGALDRSPRPSPSSRPSIPPIPSKPSASLDSVPPVPKAPRPPSSAPARIAAKSRPRRRFGSVGVLVAALVVAGGAWYAYSTRTVEPLMVARVQAPSLPVTPAADVPPTPATPVAASASPVPAPDPAPTAAEPAQRAAATPPPVAPPLIMQAPSTAAPPVAAAATAKPRKQQPPPLTPVAPASVAAPAAVVAAPAPSPAPASDPVLPSNPDAACASQGFFGRSRCMVAQCARAEYRTHPQCDAVRRQQQIDEEKRNPSLAN